MLPAKTPLAITRLAGESNNFQEFKGNNLNVGWLVGWLFGVYGISTFVGYLTPNPFFLHIISSISNNSVQHEYTV